MCPLFGSGNYAFIVSSDTSPASLDQIQSGEFRRYAHQAEVQAALAVLAEHG